MTLLSKNAVPMVTPTDIYTVPAGKAAIIKACFAVTGDNMNATSTINLFKRTVGGYRVKLNNNTTVASTATVSLLADVLCLSAGEKLQCSVTASNFTSPFTALKSDLPIDLADFGTSSTLMGNSSGVLLVATSSGIWRTTDEGVTWARVYFGLTPIVSWAYIGTTFFAYLTATTALKSTDGGLTWTTQAVTGAPINTGIVSATGRIIKVGSAYYGVSTSSTQLVTSTDGITWTNYGATLPAGTILSLCWTGTNFVIASNNVAGCYYSPNGTTWTAVSTGGIAPARVVSNGSGVVFALVSATSMYYSVDHGVTFNISSQAITSYINPFFTGTHIVMGTNGTSNTCIVPILPSQPEAKYSLVGSGALAGNTIPNKVFVAPTKTYHINGSSLSLFQSYSNDMTVAPYGAEVIASLMEIDA